jgi:hypothetical protein
MGWEHMALETYMEVEVKMGYKDKRIYSRVGECSSDGRGDCFKIRSGPGRNCLGRINPYHLNPTHFS